MRMQVRKSKYSDNQSGGDYCDMGDIVIGGLYAVPHLLGSIAE